MHPYGLLHSNGHWFLIGHCERAESIRIFRLDRMVAAKMLAEPADIPDDVDVEATLRNGRATVTNAEDVLRVQYSPRIARWIAEHQSVETQHDGSVIVDHPLLDDDWAVRHVLQYGPDAEVLEPPRVREMVRERLELVLSAHVR